MNLKKALPTHPIRLLNQSTIRFFLLLALLALIALLILEKDENFSSFSKEHLKDGLFGLLFDLVVFGFLVSFYDAFKEIGRLQEEIDDFRYWKEPAATYRIAGAIKRLNDLGVTKIKLNRCFLQKAPLWDTDLQGANLYRTDLEGAILEGANLKGVKFDQTILSGARLKGAKVEDNWPKEWEECKIKGFDEIISKYRVDQGVLIEK